MTILSLSRLIETSTLGAAQLGEQVLRLQRCHEQVTGVTFLPQKVGHHTVVKVGVRFVPKPAMTEDEARRWFQHKTTSWLNGYAVYDLEEVRCEPAGT